VADSAVEEDYSQDFVVEDQDGEAGSDAAKQKRDRSTIRFPYSGLPDVVQAVEKMYHDYGGRCGPDQLAATLGQTASSGAFRIKVSTAHLVGAIEVHRGMLSLTELGRRLADEEARPQALIEAFLNVELYERIYSKYQGQRLPRDTGLESDMVAFGVAPKQASRARQAFQRSADLAGFFWQGRDRLVLPPTGQAGTLAGMTAPDSSTAQEPTIREPDVLRGRHQLIVGLIRELPPEGDEFPEEKRLDWLKAAEVIFDLVWGKAAPHASVKKEPPAANGESSSV